MMLNIFAVKLLILSLQSSLAVQAQSTKSSTSLSSSIPTSSALSSSCPDVASNLSVVMENYFIPTILNDNQRLE